MFEHVKKPLAPQKIFARRVLSSVLLGLSIILISLLGGMAGYHSLGGLSWVDSFQEAAMILSGMGPTATMESTAGKIFSGCYALYSGLALIVTIGVMFAPLIHRFFHALHLDIEKK